MPHRGPDDWGVCYRDFPLGKLTLFQSRLSIIGLGEQGHQPFIKHPEYLLVYNGEIYNFKSIREQLRQECGVVFDTETDTEVLYEALIHWGVDVTLDRLSGMFAFAFVDVQGKQMILVRDHVGIKPLYYHASKGQVLFASEAKVFFDLGLIRPLLNREVLGEYLANCWVYEPDTLFQGIKKLEAGCCLTISLEDGRAIHRRYWDITRTTAGKIPDIAKIVKGQIVSDVPVGAYFSGGIDSSIIACCLRDEDVAFLNLKVGTSEAKRVKTLEHLYGLNVQRLEPDQDRLELYCQLIRQMDEPIADPAIVPAYLLAKKSKEMGRTVMLSGMGGDEIDAGYSRHAMLHRIMWLRWLRWIPDGVIRAFSRGKRTRDLLRLKAFMENPNPENYFSLTYYLTTEEVSELVGAPWQEPYAAKIKRICGHLGGLKRFFYLDFKGFLASHNLIYMDKASMAASVEVRVPFLDRGLVEAMFAAVEIRGNCGKRRLRGVLKSFLGNNYQKLRKEGFTYQVNQWIRSEIPWMEVIDFFRRTRVIRVEPLERWVAALEADVDAVAMKLWIVYTFYVWMKAFDVSLSEEDGVWAAGRETGNGYVRKEAS